MTNLNINNAVSSNLANAFPSNEDYVYSMNTDGSSGQKETYYQNSKWSKFWGYFNQHADLKSAILMKAIWDVGKGYSCDISTKTILDHVTGMGKETFKDVLFNMDVCRFIGRDSFAEIIRSKKGTLINLKPLDPSSIRIVVDEAGILLRYEQVSKISGKTIKFKPNEIFHLSNNRLADQIHGISVIEGLDKTMLADIESFDAAQLLMKKVAKPFIIFRLKTDDQVKINTMANKIDKILATGENLYIPDDENILSYEVVQIPMQAAIFTYQQNLTNRFYRALGLPLIIFGASGSTESGSKMEYFAHEQVFAQDQRYLESQVLNQLALEIKLISPTSMAPEMAQDTAKDGSEGTNIQPSDTTAGVGK